MKQCRMTVAAVLGVGAMGMGVALAASETSSQGADPSITSSPKVEPAYHIGREPPSASVQPAGISAEAARALAEEAGATGRAEAPMHQRRGLVRGKPLPTDVQFLRPPAEMLLKLPIHRGFEWRIVGRDLVLIRQTSAVISDIVFDVFK